MTRETADPTSRGPDAREADEPPAERVKATPATNPTEDPEVGLAQKGSGEEAIVRRETEI
jgi:hypothetical protein